MAEPIDETKIAENVGGDAAVSSHVSGVIYSISQTHAAKVSLASCQVACLVIAFLAGLFKSWPLGLGLALLYVGNRFKEVLSIRRRSWVVNHTQPVTIVLELIPPRPNVGFLECPLQLRFSDGKCFSVEADDGVHFQVREKFPKDMAVKVNIPVYSDPVSKQPAAIRFHGGNFLICTESILLRILRLRRPRSK